MLATALYWFLALELFSLAAFPLAYRVFSRLPDRGWALSKPLGLLLVGVGTWGVGLSHLTVNSRLSVTLALAVVALLSWRAARGRTAEMRAFLRAHASVVLSTELLFIAAFLGVAALRASVSDIAGTEQPMDLMFLNATVTSPYYPPNDPWLAGEAVSYYYMGYLFMGALALFTGLSTPVAYNLGLATAAGLGGVAAFGLTFNLIRLARGSGNGAVLGGMAAAFLLLVASNLSGALELGRAAGAGDAAFWESVGIKDLTAPTAAASSWYPEEFRWWWRASRVSTVLNGQELAITEFPLFSLVLGDMHPHVMSMGFLLLAAALAVQAYLLPGVLRARALVREWPLALASVAVVGALGAINMWDLPVGFVMLAGALLLNAARHERTMQFGAAVAMSGGTTVVGAPGDPEAAPGAGSAFVYLRGPKGWRRDARLTPADPHAGAGFGASVAFDGTLAVVGAPSASAAYLFERAEGEWRQLTTIRAPDGAMEFGRSVAVDKGLVAVGARGAVYVYAGTARTWPLGAELAPRDVSDRFGTSVALQHRTLVVGDSGSGQGNVHVFTRRGESAWTQSAQITGPARGFGRSVSVSDRLIAVGAEGAAVVFVGSARAWEEQAVLRAPGGRTVPSFGAAVAIGQRYLAVGAPQASHPAPSSGAAYIYERERAGQAWSLHAELTAAGAGVDARFGSAVAIDSDSVAVGTPGIGHGAAHIVDRALDAWNPTTKLIARWRFGRAVLAVALLATAVLVLLAPFIATFESNADGILPVRALLTRPLHLLLLWGVPGFLVLPVFFLAMRSVFRRGNWSLMRFGIALFIGFGPVALWLQPVWGPPFFVVALLFNGLVVMLFSLHRAGYRLPRADEMVFALNSGMTRVAGTLLLVGLLVYDGVRYGERGIDGRFLAVDRLLIVVPMAAVVALSIYGAWTLAHRDSETARSATAARSAVEDRQARNDGVVPVLLLLAVGAALIMGVELFHVCDTFCGGGDGSLRRFNTVFKLYYQAWLLMAVLGGFGLWYVARLWDRRVLWGRVGVTAWTALLVVALGAVSYYPLAAVTTRANDGAESDLNGQAYLLRTEPAEYDAIQWIRDNTARDAVVIESPVTPCANEPAGCSSYATEAGRISGSTGRPTVIGWIGHERFWWRSGDRNSDIDRRVADVRTIYETEDDALARELLSRYEVSYVVVGDRERAAYGEAGTAKFGRLGTPVFGQGTGVTVYELAGGGPA